jgi:hypothetical protein
MFNINLDLNSFNHKFIIFLLLSLTFTLIYYNYDLNYKNKYNILDYYILSLKIQTFQSSNINFIDNSLQLIYISHTLLIVGFYIYCFSK